MGINHMDLIYVVNMDFNIVNFLCSLTAMQTPFITPGL